MSELVAYAGDKAARRYANFFASIANDNTGAAYQRPCLSFFAWCETKGIADLIEVEPLHVDAYLKAIDATHETPTVRSRSMRSKELLYQLTLPPYSLAAANSPEPF